MHKSGLRLACLIAQDGNSPVKFDPSTTVVSLLEGYARELADHLALRFIDYSSGEGENYDYTWGQFITKIKAIAARIQQISQRGDRVAICCRQSLEYVVAFFGAIFAGNVAVPLFEPSEIGHSDRLEVVIKDSKPTVVLTETASAADVRAFFRNLPAKERPRIIAVDAVPDDVSTLWWDYGAKENQIAYIQYTSGSTRTPRGVEVSHEAVATNALQIAAAMQVDQYSVGVSWLPLFHDMGLLSLLLAVLGGGQMTLLSPSAFVRRPGRWLKAISDTSADPDVHMIVAASPNFAYELAATRGVPKNGEILNLSKAVLLNGSEPISLTSMQKFYSAFAPHGLSENALKPCYGLAEATLLVSCTPRYEKAKIKYVDRNELGAGRFIELEQNDPQAIVQVSCGIISKFQVTTVVDPESCIEQPDGQIGEIWCHGQNIGSGYWGNSKDTKYTFKAKLEKRLPEGSHAGFAGPDALWMRTGDLGCYYDGELYVTGRIKDLIIIGGRNHYPNDIEATADEASSALRAGYTAAFTVSTQELAQLKLDGLQFDRGDNSEQLIVVAERASGIKNQTLSEIVDAVRSAISLRHGLALRELLLVPAGAIPRTSSGKIAHQSTKKEYLDGTLRSRATVDTSKAT